MTARMQRGPLVRITMLGAVRSLRRSRGFFLFATLSMGAALGLSCATFAWVDSLTHPRPLFANPERLFSFSLYHGDRRDMPSALDVVRGLRTLGAVEGVTTSIDLSQASMRTTDGVLEGVARAVPPKYFDVLGVQPVLGYIPSTEGASGGQAAVVDAATWDEHFARRVHIGEPSVTVAGQTYRIVGVVPADRSYPGWRGVWIPLSSDEGLAREPGTLAMYVRFRSGVRPQQALVQLAALVQRFTLTRGRENRPFQFDAKPLVHDPAGWSEYEIALFAAPGLVLLIACANVAALLLVRGAARRRTYAIRLALGATWQMLASEILAEVFLIALVGGVVGTVFGTWAIDAFRTSLPPELAWIGVLEPRWSYRALALSFCALLISVAIGGGLPALQVARVAPAEPLKEGFTPHTRRLRGVRAVVMGGLALSMSMVMGAVLITRSTLRVRDFDYGYDARALLRIKVVHSYAEPPQPYDRRAVAHAAIERVRALRGVAGASVIEQRGAQKALVISDETLEGGQPLNLFHGYYDVDFGFFRTLGVSIVAGRDFESGDAGNDGAAILNGVAAKRLFPDGRAVGRRIKLGGMHADLPWIRVVGVVARVDLALPLDPSLEEPPQVFTLLGDVPASSAQATFVMVVRPQRSVRSIAVPARRALLAALPPATRVIFEPWVPQGSWALVRVFAALATASLALSIVGLFSLLAYIVSERSREFGLRRALGARRGDIVGMVFANGLELALGGMALGAFVGMRGVVALDWPLFGVYPVDAESLLIAEGLVLVLSLVACFLPALQAMRSDPAQILRAT